MGAWIMADGDALVIGTTNSGSATTELQGDSGGFAVGFEVVTPGTAGETESAAIIGRSPESRTGVLGIGSPGVAGRASLAGQTGVEGHSDTGYGVTGIGGNIGVFAQNLEQNTRAFLGTRGLAGDFYGDVFIHGNISIDGNLSKKSGGFQIDHPQHPADKILSHSFVESSEMKNVYDGITGTDANGEATIELPEWFESLNGSFRYQLTSIGGPAPDLHIAQEITENRFKIAGGTPNVRISWQVTGVRHDAWAQANAMVAEQDKPEDERG
jgi:hypothetical protein